MDTVLITGGSKGLGRASVKKWLLEGWTVATCAREETELAQLDVEMNSPNLITQALDVSDPVAVHGFVERLLGRWKHIDVLINNASILGPREKIENYPDDIWQQVVEINLNGAFYFTK